MGLRTPPPHRSCSQMRTGLVNLVLSFLAVTLFWIYHCADRGQTNARWFENQKKVFTYGARGVNKSVQLVSHELLRWIAAKGLDVIDSPLRQSIHTVIGSFCHLGTHESSTNLYQKCCLQLEKLRDEDEAVWCLHQLGSIGSLPIVREAQNGSRLIPPEAPNFVHPPMYFDEPGSSKREINCHVKLTKRKKVYKLLRHWISLAERHGIVWWLSFGSLLGSVRHKDFIPYDHDVDIAVLGSYEDVLRSLSITWREVNYNETGRGPGTASLTLTHLPTAVQPVECYSSSGKSSDLLQSRLLTPFA
ncbi:hypothetical protein CRM22_011223 [Opisthorchis felineus]|uniref:LicD/FKTN/FKRP nucleotidyltransferase domain-containing protein n=1 Tax=Opisthorchis felineus TaxID=147828 RepID=A0A4S2JZG1_OPIFE|nr:hypothetical protein CRM22_011223 [Opisthorchis felineus]